MLSKFHLSLLISAALLAACSPDSSSQNPLPSASAVATNTPASVPVVASGASAVNAVAVQAVSVPALSATSTPKEQAKILHQLMQQFAQQAAERMQQAQAQNPKLSEAQSRMIIQNEMTAIRQNVNYLKSLNLSDKEIASVRDALAMSMAAYADTADLQVRSSEAAEHKQTEELHKINQELGVKIAKSQEWQQISSNQYHQLMKKYQLKQDNLSK